MDQNRLNIIHGGTIASMVDLGGSLAVASRGLYATGVSTDLNGELGWVQVQVLSETHIPIFQSHISIPVARLAMS